MRKGGDGGKQIIAAGPDASFWMALDSSSSSRMGYGMINKRAALSLVAIGAAGWPKPPPPVAIMDPPKIVRSCS